MDLQGQVDALESAIVRLGVPIVEEVLPEEAQVDGGLCTVDGRRVVYLAASVPPWRRVEVLVDALRRLPHQALWVPPVVRRLLQDQQEQQD